MGLPHRVTGDRIGAACATARKSATSDSCASTGKRPLCTSKPRIVNLLVIFGNLLCQKAKTNLLIQP
jgi:hypothetical protein